jgi:hypothetical protein
VYSDECDVGHESLACSRFGDTRLSCRFVQPHDAIAAPGLSNPTPTRPGRRWPRRVAVGIVVVVLVGGAAYAIQASRTAGGDLVSHARPMPTASPSAALIPVTQVGDRTPARGQALRRQITDILTSQSDSLLRADQAGFIGPATGAAKATLTRHYRNLTLMKVTRFQLLADPPTVDPKTGLWKTTVSVLFCFVVPECEMDTVTESQTWKDAAEGPQLLTVAPVVPGEDSWFGWLQPWQSDDLYVSIGTRTLVATTSALKSRLPELLQSAEQGAGVADTFAIGSKPDLYRIYLAGDSQWKRWYGGNSTSWAAGFTFSTGGSHSDVVLDNVHAPASYLDTLLTHEMTHVATVYGQFYWENNFWLIEGIANVAALPGGLTVATWRDQTRGYIHSGWNRKLPTKPPADNASPRLAGELYGIAFLAMKRLDKRFGRAKLIDFFTQVVRSGAPLKTASTVAFGMDWSAVQADIITSIRNN